MAKNKKWDLVPTATGIFSGMDLLTRFCFGLIYDRHQLSQERTESGSSAFIANRSGRVCDFFPRHFPTDESMITVNDVYCVYTQADLASAMGCTARTVRRCIKELKDAGLITAVRSGYNGAYRFFISSRVYDYFNRDISS